MGFFFAVSFEHSLSHLELFHRFHGWRFEIADVDCSKFDDACFRNKWSILLEFLRSKKTLPIFLSNVKISIWTFLFYKKNVRKKVNFLIIQIVVISYCVFVRIPFTAWKVSKDAVFLVRIFPHLDWIRKFKSPYSVQIRENTDQKNSVFGRFSRSEFWSVLRHLSALSKKHTFATLVNKRQMLWQFKR